MKVAVTGACGFLGSHLSERLDCSDTFEPVALVRKTSNKKNLAGTNVEFREVDFSDTESLKKALNDIEIVINCIALLGDYDHLPRSTHLDIDAGILTRLIDSVNPEKLKQFIHVSTTGVYGGKLTPEPVKEDTPHSIKVSKYEWGKIKAEKVILEKRKTENFPITIARPGPIFGPRMLYGWPNLMKRLKTGNFRIIGTGAAKFHITYVADAVEGIFLLIGQEKAIGAAYNICGNEIPTIKEYFSAIAAELNGPGIKHIPYLPVFLISHLLQVIPKKLKPGDLSLLSPARVLFFKEHRIFDVTKLKSDFGYQPTFSLKEGIKKAVDWYKENGYFE